jgi:hypothetical protein
MLILVALLLVGAQIRQGTQIENGIYFGDVTGPMVNTQDGQDLHIGSKQTFRIVKAELLSQDNANTKFLLSLTVPHAPKLALISHILVFDGAAYRQSGSFSDNKVFAFRFSIDGKDRALQAGKYFKAKVIYRRHPHHCLDVFFTPIQEEFRTDEEVSVVLHIRNVGNNAVAFSQGGRNRGSRDNQYLFCARYEGKQIDDIGGSDGFGGLSQIRELKPGDVFEDTVNLSKWFVFDKPGLYVILGTYYLEFRDPEDNSMSFRVMWTDYASAEFIVRIKESKEDSNKRVEATR